MKIHEVRRYRIYETPSTCRYQLEDALDIDVIWDGGYWLAHPSDPNGSNMYGTGDSIKKAIRDLIETMDADYRSDIKHLRQNPGGQASVNYAWYTKLFFKK